MAAKKILTGCLVVVLVAAVALGATWWFVLRPMWSAGVSGARDWATTLDLGQEITNDAPFAPPADGRLTPEQVEALVRVHSVISREMGADLASLAERAQAAHAARERNQPPTMQDVVTTARELSSVMSKLRRVQAAGVNEAGLSRQEYAFVRKQALAALPLLVDVGSVPVVPGLPLGGPGDPASMGAAQYNAELLRPHLPLLERTLRVMPSSR